MGKAREKKVQKIKTQNTDFNFFFSLWQRIKNIIHHKALISEKKQKLKKRKNQDWIDMYCRDREIILTIP